MEILAGLFFLLSLTLSCEKRLAAESMSKLEKRSAVFEKLFIYKVKHAEGSLQNFSLQKNIKFGIYSYCIEKYGYEADSLSRNLQGNVLE